MNTPNRIAADILNAKSRTENRATQKDFCDTCKDKGGSRCRGCDGRKNERRNEK